MQLHCLACAQDKNRDKKINAQSMRNSFNLILFRETWKHINTSDITEEKGPIEAKLAGD